MVKVLTECSRIGDGRSALQKLMQDFRYPSNLALDIEKLNDVYESGWRGTVSFGFAASLGGVSIGVIMAGAADSLDVGPNHFL